MVLLTESDKIWVWLYNVIYDIRKINVEILDKENVICVSGVTEEYD